MSMYSDIIRLINQHRIKEAFVQIESLTESAEFQEQKSELRQCEIIYKYMLEYIANGASDPTREHIYLDIQRRCYALVDQIEFMQKTAKSHMRQELQKQQSGNDSLTLPQRLSQITQYGKWRGLTNFACGDVVPRYEEDRALDRKIAIQSDCIFNQIWASACWSENDYRSALEVLSIHYFPTNTLALMISAITLNQIYLFDARKLRFLLDAYFTHDDRKIVWRALVGIVLTIYYNEDKLHYYPEIVILIDRLSKSEKAKNELYTLQNILLYTRETEDVTRKMEKDIIPSFIKNNDWLTPDKKNIKLDDVEEAIAANPEWSKDIEDMQEQIKEISKMQAEGADTQWGAFVHLKTFGFFQIAAHWFYMFDIYSPYAIECPKIEILKKDPFFKMMVKEYTLCDSDKYSLMYALSIMPEKAKPEFPRELISDTVQEPDDFTIARFYIADLYRFFKIWKFRSEQLDIFADPLALWKNATLAKIFATPKVLHSIADHLINFNYTQEASEIYGQLCKTQSTQTNLWEKYGYTLQLQKEYADALEAYNKADLIKPDSVWIVKQKMLCYKHLGKHEDALHCLLFLLEKEPDNIKLCQQVGQCYIRLGQYDKALSYLFKAEYMDRIPDNARRGIAWCYFMMDQYDNAMKFYNKLQEYGIVKPSDWLNIGHLHLVQRHIPEALECYKKADSNEKHEDFITSYLADYDLLKSKGVNDDLIFVIPDMMQ